MRLNQIPTVRNSERNSGSLFEIMYENDSVEIKEYPRIET